MKRFLIIALVGVVALGLALVLISTRGKVGTTSSVEPTPYAAALLHSDQAVSVAALHGKLAVLSSWATWCVECQHELPSLETLWQSRKDQGLQVVAVNIDVEATNPAIDGMIQSMKLTMPIWHDPDNNYAAYINAPGVPTSVLLDANGRVQKIWFGRTDFQSADVLSVIDGALKG